MYLTFHGLTFRLIIFADTVQSLCSTHATTGPNCFYMEFYKGTIHGGKFSGLFLNSGF